MNSHNHRLLVRFAFAWGLFSVCVCISGCTESKIPSSQKSTPSLEETLSADEILGNMATAYRNAKSYSDRAQYHEMFVRKVDGIEEDVPPHMMGVAYERPNRVRISRTLPHDIGISLNVQLRCNGKITRGFVSDYPNQVVEATAPEKLTVDNLTESGAIKNSLFPFPLQNMFPQLQMLLAAGNTPPALFTGMKATVLEPRKLDGFRCFRVKLETPNGPSTLWIDKESYLLRRLELPTANLLESIDPEGKLRKLTLWIDFHQATFNTTIPDEAFEMEVLETVHLLKELVPPVAHLPEKLGDTLGKFSFKQLPKGTLNNKSFEGKVTVLDFWSTTCGPCKQSTPALETLYQKYRKNKQFAAFAVSVDPKWVEHKTVEETLKSWGTALPIVRDPTGHSALKLGFELTPTTLLIGPKGEICKIHIGLHEDFSDWNEAIDQLLAGKDVAQLAIDEQQRLQDEYEKRLKENAAE